MDVTIYHAHLNQHQFIAYTFNIDCMSVIFLELLRKILNAQQMTHRIIH